MIVDCDVSSCVHWCEQGGNFIDRGGCTLNMIRVSEDTLTGGGFLPLCRYYEREASRGDNNSDQ